MDLDDFLARHELRDPQALLDEIEAAGPLLDGRVFLALVHQPATLQKLLALEELTPLPTDIDKHHRGRSDLLYERCGSFRSHCGRTRRRQYSSR